MEEVKFRLFPRTVSPTWSIGDVLELVYEDSNPAFLTDLGVFEGVARRWVRDVKIFLEQFIAF